MFLDSFEDEIRAKLTSVLGLESKSDVDTAVGRIHEILKDRRLVGSLSSRWRVK